MSLRPAGYALLRERYQIQTLPSFVSSQIAETGGRRSIIDGGERREVYPRSYWPGDSDFDHLEFALKYEGLNLPQLRALLRRLNVADLTAWVKSKPPRRGTN